MKTTIDVLLVLAHLQDIIIQSPILKGLDHQSKHIPLEQYQSDQSKTKRSREVVKHWIRDLWAGLIDVTISSGKIIEESQHKGLS